MNKSEQLIACLEGEIAKRDARIVELERYQFAFNEWHDKTEWVQAESATLSAKYLGCHRADVMRSLIDDLREELAACRVAVENCEVFRARIAEMQERFDSSAHRTSLIGRLEIENAQLSAELSALKAQDTVGEVVGWYRLDRPYEMTSYPSVCATWHKLGAPVAPLYAAPAAPAADAWIPVSERLPNIAQEVIVHSEFDGVCAGVLDSYGEWFAPCSEYKLIRVTSWMPMPTKIEANRHD